ncbi:3-methyl-2-oxobutanoate hydroxymethyltransferase [Anthocerotibacter panamensis]|uniref:3-methyl-2-oxobutanoate hydroxymethyltransferase n=1 Tax=Anthocerotibacter panamensis TaxID=2857077 RepID=UPI001C406763|nr:3-methyl-2-oxobutanoate hydroxymethyltransferase [Anthocerotibacter panamensis]
MALTIRHIQNCHDHGQPIVALTATEYTLAQILDRSGVDLLLVGDSLAMVALGHKTTLPVSVEEMLSYTRAVVRGAQRALVIADLPFGSYELSPEQAFGTASRFLREAGAQGVKVEGGSPAMAETVAFLVERGIPVLGHLGLTPQAVHQLGGFRQQAKTPEAAHQLEQTALRLQEAGAFALVLEHIPDEVAAHVTQKLAIATLGIGAGPHCSGQILVTHDLLGLTEHCPPFVKPVLDLKTMIHEAIVTFSQQVRSSS